ncbi:MAG: hypothetical protein R3249_10775 [Nitriliruptorales bacterium]|nr:hypothetical protein [Nitriliruptorales bacterium]
MDWVQDNWNLLLLPLISGLIGWVTNWVGIKLLFYPIRMVGFRLPGLAAVAKKLPRKLQGVPGLVHGIVGWQGVIPSRAAKMGSIAVDKGIAKLGSPAEFYEQLEPDRIAEHIIATARDDIREVVERIMEREHPQLWRDMPAPVRDAVHARVQQQLPGIVRKVTGEIGTNIDQLLDIKLMVIRHIEQDPSLANRIFLEVGSKELRFVITSGLWLGAILGLPNIWVVQAFPDVWWYLPLAGVFVGYLTNWIAIKVIFLPETPKRFGPLTLHGLFMRRQPEVSEVYSKVIADDIVTLANIGRELLDGPRSDRTRDMLENALRPAVDRSLGPARSAVRVALGTRQYDSIRESVASDAVEYTMTPFTDPEFNAQQGEAIRRLLTERMLELPPDDFAEMLRSAIQEDEWMLIFIGSVLGFVAGTLQILTVV